MRAWAYVRRAAAIGAILGPAFGWSLLVFGRAFRGRPPVTAFKAWLNVSVILAPFSMNALVPDTTPVPGRELTFSVAQALLNGLFYATVAGLSLALRGHRLGRWTLGALLLVWIVWNATLIWVRRAWVPAP